VSVPGPYEQSAPDQNIVAPPPAAPAPASTWLAVAEKAGEAFVSDVLAKLKADERYEPMIASMAEQLLAQLAGRAAGAVL
jgi:hypothetical protein